MIEATTEQPGDGLTLNDDRIELNVAKARAVAAWLDALEVRIRPADRGAISGDLSDLYVAAARCQELVDALLATSLQGRERLTDLIAEVTTELRHLGWHSRSVVGRLDRLEDSLTESAAP